MVDFVDRTPRKSVVIAFPPTYDGGYEAMYAKLDSIFEWDRPAYETFNEQSFGKLVEVMQRRTAWLTMRDKPEEAISDLCIGMVQTSLRMRPVYVYAGEGTPRLAMSRQKVEQVEVPRLEEEVGEDVRLVNLTPAQFNSLRSQYLATAITPAAIQLGIGVLSNGRLLGAIGLTRPYHHKFCGVYMMSDFCVRPSVYKRLSKLVLAVVLSDEVKVLMERKFNQRVRTVGTTVFTTNAVSMKYRGLFNIEKKHPDKITYVASTGRWSLSEAFRWWEQKHGELK